MSGSQTQKLLKRKIKEAVRARLLNGTPAGEAVFLSRSIPVQYEEQTVLLIYSTGETSRAFDESPKRYRRALGLRIEAISSGNDDDDLDQKLENLADAIEDLMEHDDTFGGLSNSIEYQGCDYQTDDAAASPMGMVAMRYEIEFFTYAVRPEAFCLDALKIVDTKWKIGHNNAEPDNVIDAENKIEPAQ